MLTRSRLWMIGGALLAAASVAPSPTALLPAATAAPKAAPAKAGAKPAAESSAPSRSYSELAGKFQWGMTPEQVMAVVEKEITDKFQPKIMADPDPVKQDAVRKEKIDAIEQMRSSYIKFSGQRTGWDVSLIDREYGHRNNESMLVMWEPNQRRFLFFFKEKLYKQFIAYNAERFAGKVFDEFVEGMQVRYGKAEMNFAKKQTEDEMALDYYQWQPSGDFVMRAMDQSSFYGNFCLSLLQKSSYEIVEKERSVNSPPRVRRTNVHVVDQVTEGNPGGDPNADVIDDVVGKRALPSVEQKRVQERIMKEYKKDHPTPGSKPPSP